MLGQTCGIYPVCNLVKIGGCNINSLEIGEDDAMNCINLLTVLSRVNMLN